MLLLTTGSYRLSTVLKKCILPVWGGTRNMRCMAWPIYAASYGGLLGFLKVYCTLLRIIYSGHGSSITLRVSCHSSSRHKHGQISEDRKKRDAGRYVETRTQTADPPTPQTNYPQWATQAHPSTSKRLQASASVRKHLIEGGGGSHAKRRVHTCQDTRSISNGTGRSHRRLCAIAESNAQLRRTSKLNGVFRCGVPLAT